MELKISFCSFCFLTFITKSIIKIANKTPRKINKLLDEDRLVGSLSKASCSFVFSSFGPSEIEDLNEVSAGTATSFLFVSVSLDLFISEFKSGLDSIIGGLLVKSFV